MHQITSPTCSHRSPTCHHARRCAPPTVATSFSHGRSGDSATARSLSLHPVCGIGYQQKWNSVYTPYWAWNAPAANCRRRRYKCCCYCYFRIGDALATGLLRQSETSSSAIAETALQGGLVMAKSGRLEPGDNIYGHYRSIFNHCDAFGQQRNRNRRKTQNNGYYAVQGHPRSSRSISIESPYAISY